MTAFTTIIVKVCAFIFMGTSGISECNSQTHSNCPSGPTRFFPTFLPMFAVLHGVIPLWVQEDLINRIIHMNAGTKGKCFFFTVFSSQTVLNLLVRICLVFTYFSMVHFFFLYASSHHSFFISHGSICQCHLPRPPSMKCD